MHGSGPHATGNRELRRYLCDLVALTALPAVWSAGDRQRIAESLTDVLAKILALDFVYLRLRRSAGEDALEAVRSELDPDLGSQARTIGKAMAPWLACATSASAILSLPHPLTNDTVQAAVVPVGHACEFGVLAAVSARLDFPTEEERLLLGVAVNQAAIVLKRQQAEGALRRSERELTDFFDNATLGLHWVGPDGTILRVNQAELDMLGYSREEYIGHNIAEFHADQEAIADILRRLQAGEQVCDYEARLRCKDGSIKHVLTNSNVLWEEGQFIHTRCFTRDVTQQTGTREALARQNERLRLLWEAAAVLLSTDSPDAMLRSLFAKIGPRLGLDAYFNFMVSEPGKVLHLESYLGVPQEKARTFTLLNFGEAISGNVAVQRQPLVATFIQQSEEPRLQLLRGLGMRACVCNPLLTGDRLLGTLSFASRSRDQFDLDELEFLQTLSRYVTGAYERVRLINQLRDSDRRKDEFLATLAHELRNPLAPIRNAVELLRRADGDKDLIEQARSMMDRQLVHMVRLVDDLLDVNRITQGKLQLRKEKIELAAVITSALEASRPLIETSAHTLDLKLPPAPLYLDADPTRLAEVFSNLLNNAAKYTERGGSLELSAAQHGGEVVVAVRDTGIGIAAENLPHIFEMFSQVNSALERSQGGLGLGLALARGLVELHGGRIEAHSEGIGMGSEFRVYLPLAKAGPAHPPRASAAPKAPAGSPCRILVVDDSKDSAHSLGTMLRMSGHEIYTAYDGQAAVRAAATLQPDVVLLDIGLPKMNGYEAARHIRAQPDGKNVVLIALTGWGQDEDKRRALEAGFDHHFTKPVDPEALEQLLTQIAPRRQT